MRRRHGWVAALVIITAWGCGTESGIFADGDSGAGAGSTITSAGGSDTGVGGDSSTSGNGGDPTTTGTGGAPTTTGTGGAPDASSTGVGGEPSTSSTGAGGDMLPPVDCGGTTCKVTDDGACCWDNHELYGPPQGECVQGTVANDGCQTFSQDEPGQPGAESRIECQSNIHCAANETCCGELRSAFSQTLNQQIFFYESVTCQQTCGGGGPGPQEVPLCDPGEANPCPQGGTCQQSTLLPSGYFVCAN